MNSSEHLDYLDNLCHGKDWFADVGFDKYNRLVVYTHFFSAEVYHFVPNQVDGKQILIHLIASKNVEVSKFVNDATKRPFQKMDYLNIDMIHEVEDKDIQYLTDELDALEKKCSSFTLQDIFYEIHDGKNAVTNMSARFPEVRNELEKLYDQYGFDVIYEELDG